MSSENILWFTINRLDSYLLHPGTRSKLHPVHSELIKNCFEILVLQFILYVSLLRMSFLRFDSFFFCLYRKIRQFNRQPFSGLAAIFLQDDYRRTLQVSCTKSCTSWCWQETTRRLDRNCLPTCCLRWYYYQTWLTPDPLMSEPPHRALSPLRGTWGARLLHEQLE